MKAAGQPGRLSPGHPTAEVELQAGSGRHPRAPAGAGGHAVWLGRAGRACRDERRTWHRHSQEKSLRVKAGRPLWVQRPSIPARAMRHTNRADSTPLLSPDVGRESLLHRIAAEALLKPVIHSRTAPSEGQMEAQPDDSGQPARPADWARSRFTHESRVGWFQQSLVCARSRSGHRGRPARGRQIRGASSPWAIRPNGRGREHRCEGCRPRARRVGG